MAGQAQGAVMQGRRMCLAPLRLGVKLTKEANGKRQGRKALSPPLRTAPCACPAYCLLDDELLSARQIIRNVNHLFLSVVNHLVYINIAALHHFLNKVIEFTHFSC